MRTVAIGSSALRETLETLASIAPLVLQIDDVHRASPATLDAIAYCVDRTEDSAIRWQFAARPGSDVDRVWEDIARDGVLRFIDVPPLDESETRTLARAIAGDAPRRHLPRDGRQTRCTSSISRSRTAWSRRADCGHFWKIGCASSHRSPRA